MQYQLVPKGFNGKPFWDVQKRFGCFILGKPFTTNFTIHPLITKWCYQDPETQKWSSSSNNKDNVRECHGLKYSGPPLILKSVRLEWRVLESVVWRVCRIMSRDKVKLMVD